ncbi:MAG: aminotransferase class V-fold PLP-dependent enzyme, partial [Acidimicrobiia bacterium]
LAGGALDTEAEEARRLTDRLLSELPAAVPGLDVYGDPVGRLPHLVCLGLAGVEAEPVLLGLDQQGVAVHSGSSCSSEALEPSPVLQAMGLDADHSLRVSVGWTSNDADIDRFLGVMPGVVERLRGLRTSAS